MFLPNKANDFEKKPLLEPSKKDKLVLDVSTVSMECDHKRWVKVVEGRIESFEVIPKMGLEVETKGDEVFLFARRTGGSEVTIRGKGDARFLLRVQVLKQSESVPTSVLIEVLGGPRYKGEDEFYLVKGKEPAKTLGEVESFLGERKGNVEVQIILTDDSAECFLKTD